MNRPIPVSDTEFAVLEEIAEQIIDYEERGSSLRVFRQVSGKRRRRLRRRDREAVTGLLKAGLVDKRLDVMEPHTGKLVVTIEGARSLYAKRNAARNDAGKDDSAAQ